MRSTVQESTNQVHATSENWITQSIAVRAPCPFGERMAAKLELQQWRIGQLEAEFFSRRLILLQVGND
jgi:hypothetical protein